MEIVNENFYILLELPFDPPETDSGRIKAALNKKKQEWVRAQDIPSRRAEALKYLAMLEEIEATLKDPAKREEQAKQAKELKPQMVRQFEAELRIVEGKGYLLPKEVSAISVKYKPYGITKDDVLAQTRCPIGDTPPISAIAADKGEMLDKMTAKAIRRSLSLLGYEDLYSFLGEQPYSSIKKLSDAADQKRREAGQSAAKTAEVTSIVELAGICLKLFTDFDSKQRYDRYLKVSKYPELNDLIDQEYNRAKHLSPTILLRMVNFAVEKHHLKVLDAEDYIRRYCTAYDIPVESVSQQIACPACSAQVLRGTSACASCGAPLKGECPGCGAPFEDGPAVCSACGFSIAEMVKAMRFVDDAQNALIENNWGTAQRNGEFAKKYWPGHPQIEFLEKRARALEDRYSRYIDTINDCVRHNQYYAALEMITEARARQIRLPLATTSHVESVIEELEKKTAKLSSQYTDNLPPFEKVYELANAVSDSIELSRMMAKHPPSPPRALTALLFEDEVRLSWGESPSPGIKEYILVRKRGNFPITAYDGDVLYDGAASSYIDATAKTLCEYYYSVFCKRCGGFSKNGVSAGPVLIIPEIEGLRILPTDQGAQIDWKINPSIREVIIWRKLGGERPTAPGEGIRLENTRLDGVFDQKIKNDVDYWYYISAAYMVDGKKVYSRGICESVTPHKMVAPPAQLVVVASDTGEDEYVVNWQSAEFSDILLMATPRRPRHKPGDTLPVGELLEQYRKLELAHKRADSARFNLQFHGGVYIFVAAPYGKFATIGQSVYLTNVKNVENITFDVIGEEMFLNMKWPQGLLEIQVAYRFDRYVTSSDEAGGTILNITREQYDFDAAVVIKEPEQLDYYFTIYSVFVTPDGDRVVSEGAEFTARNMALREVFYQFKVRKRFFLKEHSVKISLSAPQQLTLPPAVFTGKVGRMPLSKSDGMQLFELKKEARLSGEITYQYRMSRLPKDLYIRMFLQDEEQSDTIRLLPAAYVKIT